MNFFKFYIGDYQRDTAHLSITEHGAYVLMLQHYYATEKPLPTGKALHRMLRAQDKAERDAIDAIAAQFWQATDTGLVNERADAEITKANAQAETNRTIAQQREARRKATREGNEQSTNRATNDQPNHNHSQTPPHSKAIRGERASRLPADWVLPKSWGEWAMAEQPSWSAEHCRKAAASFADYWQAKAGKDATKLDWEKTWHTWVRREGPMRVQGGGFQQASGPVSPSVSPEIAKTRALLESQQISPEQIEANRVRAAEIRAQLKAVG